MAHRVNMCKITVIVSFISLLTYIHYDLMLKVVIIIFDLYHDNNQFSDSLIQYLRLNLNI